MLKTLKILLLLIIFLAAFYFSSCTSGEYEVEQYKVDYTEKTIKIDTLKKITIDENKNNSERYTFTIQIGAFSINENFQRFYNQAVGDLGSGVYHEYSGSLHKIRIGKFNNRSEAVKYTEYVRSKGYSDAFVITRKF
ncbi:MAG: SPOR domain-containing protein [Ignavibacteria bacterium]|nr:SPOR domain-containing protein [Ignavibacteria bacterium]